MRPKLLDMYCCAGGAAMGYHRAGFDVIGVDIKPQPNYPFPFIRYDCTALSPEFLDCFDAVHASPPCQAHTTLRTMPNAKKHLDLIPETWVLLQDWGGPWIMENVVGAPMLSPITLCGSMFGLGVDDAELRRHRQFEANFPISPPGPCAHGSRSPVTVMTGHTPYNADNRENHKPRTIGIYGEGARDSWTKTERQKVRTIGIYGTGVQNAAAANSTGVSRGARDFTGAQGRVAMGMTDWRVTNAELSQAIPPAYTEWLGAQLMAEVLRRAA